MECCSSGFVSQRHSLNVLSTIINQDEIVVGAIKRASSSITKIYMVLSSSGAAKVLPVDWYGWRC